MMEILISTHNICWQGDSNEYLYFFGVIWKITSKLSTNNHLECFIGVFLFEPCHEKTCLQGFHPGKTQTTCAAIEAR